MADDDAVAELAEAVDVGWILVCTALVFWEQAGFAMLEAGSVRARNLGNILFKNLLDVSLGAVVFAAVGYGLAFGDSASGVVGSTGFFLRSLESPYDYAIWAWHWSFAATAATTVSGCVAERVDCVAYLVAATLVTGVVYAVPVHWVWADGGCMSVWHGTTLLDVGVIDFAGSGLVHMVGGLGGLVGSVMLGPRLGRFPADAYRRSLAARLAVAGAREPDAGKGKADDLRGFAGHNATLTALGVYCLWFGWFGFNAGCSGGLSGGGAKVAALAAVNTALAPPCGALVALGVERWRAGYWSLPATVSGLLAGLVGMAVPVHLARRRVLQRAHGALRDRDPRRHLRPEDRRLLRGPPRGLGYGAPPRGSQETKAPKSLRSSSSSASSGAGAGGPPGARRRWMKPLG